MEGNIFNRSKFFVLTVFLFLVVLLGASSFLPSDANAGVGFNLVDDDMHMIYYETDTINVLSNDTYDDFDSLRIITDTPNGDLQFDNSGEIIYKPVNSFYGYDQFVYGLFDSGGNELGRATVLVTVVSPVTSGEHYDLYVYKTDNEASAYTCGVVIYQLVYANVGAIDAENAYLMEMVPMYTTFNDENSTPGWVCDNGECMFDLGTVSSGAEPISVFFAVSVDENIPEDLEMLHNQVMIGVTNSFNPSDPYFGDSNPDSNMSTDNTSVMIDLEMCDDGEENIAGPSEGEVEGSEETVPEESGEVLGEATTTGEVLGAATLAETGTSLSSVIVTLLLLGMSISSALYLAGKKSVIG